MIQVTLLDGSLMVLNSDIIEHIDATADTVVSLTTGQKIVVVQSADEIVKRVVSFRRAILAPDVSWLRQTAGPDIPEAK